MVEALIYGIKRRIASKRLISVILERVRNGEAVLTENKNGLKVKSKFALTSGSFLTKNTEETISIVIPGGYDSVHGLAIQRENPYKAWDKAEYDYTILEISRDNYYEVRDYFERQKQKSKVNV